METTKLNIGCGKEVLEGFLNIDKFPMDERVQKVDISKFPFPFKDNQFTFVHMRNILEHLPVEAGLKIFDELHRVVTGGGKYG